MSLIKCKECGNNISELAKQCPHCGCPLSKQISMASTKIALWSKIKEQRAKIIILGLFIIMLALGIGTLYQCSNKVSPEEYKNVARATGEEIMSLSETTHDAGTKIVAYMILEYYAGSETSDDDYMYDTSVYEKKIKDVNKANQKIKKTMNALSNPPAEYKDIYDTLCSMYSYFNDLLDLVEDPPVSYEVYSEEYDEYNSCYDHIRSSHEDLESLVQEMETSI